MIGVSKLLCGTARWGDSLRYSRPGPSERPRCSAAERRPIVVWNSTKACNLTCEHCYYRAGARRDPAEMTTQETKAMVDDLASFGVPVLLFSGGEPLIRPDLYELGEYAVSLGLRTVVSTNGTLIDAEAARRAKEAGFSYMGISLDGIGATNDRFRGAAGAFDAALEGMRNCREASLRFGLRLTLNKHNVADLNAIFDLIEAEQIPRACFYHLVYVGRGKRIQSDDLTLEETRQAVDLICDRTEDYHARGLDIEILTVDNHTDGPHLLRRLEAQGSERAQDVLELLRVNGGNASGIAISAIDHLGNVHADQFWQHYSFGNVRERAFGDIWTDTSDPLMAGLKDRKPLLKGRCATCRYLDICNGNLRVRAEAVHGDVWAPDPGCYLTDEEVTA